MGNLDLPEEDAPLPVLEPGTEGIWTTFPQTMEHLRLGKAIVVLTLDRATGDLDVDQEMSTPAETEWMLEHACEDHQGVWVDAGEDDEED